MTIFVMNQPAKHIKIYFRADEISNQKMHTWPIAVSFWLMSVMTILSPECHISLFTEPDAIQIINEYRHIAADLGVRVSSVNNENHIYI